MTNNVFEIKNQLERVAKTLHNKEKFLTGLLVGKAKKLAQHYPSDITCLDMYNFLNQRLEKQAMMSREELQKAYNTLCKTANNKFSLEFKEELGLPEQISPVKRVFSEEKDLVRESQDKYGDPVLKNALGSLFNKSQPLKSFSEKIGSQAIKCVDYQIKKSNFELPAKIEIAAGNEENIICRASFETPKGSVSILVPVKTSGDNVIFPESFINDIGLVSLNSENLKSHVLKMAGKVLHVNADKVLEYLTKEAHTEPLSEVQLAVIRLKHANSAPQYNTLGIVYKDSFEKQAQPNVETKYNVPKALLPFTQKLGSVAGEAEFVFGKTVVDGARAQIAQKLLHFGLRNSNIKVSDVSQDKVVFAVEVANKAFKVPVPVVNKLAAEPKMMIVNGSLKAFSSSGVQEMLSEDTDAQIMSVAYDCESNTVTQLSDKLKYAIAHKDFKSADNLLQILQGKNSIAFQSGVQMLKDSLEGKSIEKNASAGCVKLVRSSTSIHPICSHTGLPSNKIYQDKHGNCRPLYRKGYENQEVQENLPFASNKLYW